METIKIHNPLPLFVFLTNNARIFNAILFYAHHFHPSLPPIHFPAYTFNLFLSITIILTYKIKSIKLDIQPIGLTLQLLLFTIFFRG